MTKHGRGSRGKSVSDREVRYHWRMYTRLCDNDGGGNCWWLSFFQRYLISDGLTPVQVELALSKDDKSATEVEKLSILDSRVRELAVAALVANPSRPLRIAFTEEEPSAVTPEQIKRMALSVYRDVTNVTDWMNVILYPGGLGDQLALELLADQFQLGGFAIVEDRGNGYLRTTSDDPLPGNMVYHRNGHYMAVAYENVS